MTGDPSPGDFCRQLLGSLGASEGRRRRRKRDTTPDAIGIALKQQLLESAAREAPAAEAFEAWLVDQCRKAGPAAGPVRAVASSILEEWRLALISPAWREWLARGAPSDDADS
jgi:hypothetical protein